MGGGPTKPDQCQISAPGNGSSRGTRHTAYDLLIKMIMIAIDAGRAFHSKRRMPRVEILRDRVRFSEGESKSRS